MIGALYASISRIARHEANAKALAGIGKVVDVFPSSDGRPDHAVSVEMRDTQLVLPKVPLAVGVLGFAAIPVVGELVVVLFMQGDYNAPVVVGRLYHPDQEPPKHKDDEIVLRLPSGHEEPDLNLVIKGKEPTFKLTLPGEVMLQMIEEEVQVQIGEDISLNLTAKGGSRAEIATGGSKITLKKDGDISITAQGNLSLEATEINIKGQSKVKIEGAQVDIN